MQLTCHKTQNVDVFIGARRGQESPMRVDSDAEDVGAGFASTKRPLLFSAKYVILDDVRATRHQH